MCVCDKWALKHEQIILNIPRKKAAKEIAIIRFFPVI